MHALHPWKIQGDPKLHTPNEWLLWKIFHPSVSPLPMSLPSLQDAAEQALERGMCWFLAS